MYIKFKLSKINGYNNTVELNKLYFMFLILNNLHDIQYKVNYQ